MAGVALPEGKTLHRIDVTTTAEQPVQHAGAALVLEKLTEAEYKRNFQRVLQILMQ